jgi:hypothetical protein
MKALFSVLVVGCGLALWAGSASAQNKPFTTAFGIKKIYEEVRIDGVLDEDFWQRAEVATNFFMNFPIDTMAPLNQSEVRFAFDDTHIYVGIVCYGPRNYVVQSLRRDFIWDRNDNFSVYFDPFNDFTNGFHFGVTPYNVQREGLVENGGEVATDWDNKWYSATQQYEDKWTAEMAIPFKSIRYNSENREWNVQLLRHQAGRNERHAWIAVPQQFQMSNFAFSGKMYWEDAPPKAGTNISLIPYLAANTSRNYENNTRMGGVDAGFDAKVAVTPSLNLDLTVNPDFSQVEVDRQVINLTRFEVNFPELRQFFLENRDLFSQWGFPTTRAFFSRRIGIATDSLDRSEQIPILFGARLSGKVGRDWRVGLLNMQTREVERLGLPSQNFTVGVFQKKVFSRSNVGLIFVNKQSVGVDTRDTDRYYSSQIRKPIYSDTDTTYRYHLFNRVIGAEYNLFSADSRWEGDFYYQKSFDSDRQTGNYNHGAFLRYQTRDFSIAYFHESVGENFSAEAGFVPRVAYHRAWLRPRVFLYPDASEIVSIEFGVNGSYTTDLDFNKMDFERGASFGINFTNTARFEASTTKTYQKLFFDFNPIRPRGDGMLLAGTDYDWWEYRAFFSNNRRDLFNFQIGGSIGGFYHGKRGNISGELGYRYQPFGGISMAFDYNDVRLPSDIGSAQFILIGPRLDITFTDKLFLTTFVQYNNRFDNVNINSRFQWRFKPVSDLFVVYTENYFPGPLMAKNRALVLKLTYWLNL